MGSVDVLRNKAEEYLEKARAISDRQRARLWAQETFRARAVDTPSLAVGTGSQKGE
jgi:hypothetical protein